MTNEKLNKTTITEEEINHNDKKIEVNPKVHSRKGRKILKEEQSQDEGIPKKVFWVQLRILPIWLRLLLVIFLLAAVTVIGLRFGYGYIGDGNPADVLKKETWTHILDIIQGKE